MKPRLSERLDECLTALLSGEETVDDLLQRFPDHADRLRPLLEAAEELHQVPAPSCRRAATKAGKRRMLEALAARPRASEARLPERWRSTLVTPAARAALLAAAGIMLILAGGLLVPDWIGPGVGQPAFLHYTSAAVEVLTPDAEDWREMEAGRTLASGDRIRSGNAYVELVFFDGSSTWLEPGTDVTLVEMSSGRAGGRTVIELYQWIGSTYSTIQPAPDPYSSFSIEMAAAVAAVRGTEFRVTAEADGTTTVAVAAGQVAVTAEDVTVELSEGEETTVRPEETPAASRPCVGSIQKPVPPGQTRTPQPPGQTRTPHPPGHARTPQPQGHTGTPQPPGQTKTPEPPGQTRTPARTCTPTPTPTPTATPTTTLTETAVQPPTPTLTPTPTPTPIPHTDMLTVADGYDERSSQSLKQLNAVDRLTSSDDHRSATDYGYFTSYEFTNIGVPDDATITSVTVYCEHYEGDSFDPGALEWRVGARYPNSPTTWLTAPAPVRAGEASEGYDAWDVSSAVTAGGLVNQLQFIVKNNDAAEGTNMDHVYVVVEWLEW